MKRFKKRVLSILLAIFLVVHGCASSTLVAQANPIYYGIYDLIISLLVSAGVSVSQYNISEGLSTQAQKELKTLLVKTVLPDCIDRKLPGLASALAEVDSLDEAGELYTNLQSMDNSSSLDYEGFSILKGATGGLSVSIPTDVIQEVANAINEMAEGDDNIFTTSSTPPLSDIEGLDVQFWSTTSIEQYSSIDDIATISVYTSEVSELLADNGWNDSNCWVYGCIPSYLSSHWQYWTDDALLDDNNYYVFVAMPFGYSLVDYLSIQSDMSHRVFNTYYLGQTVYYTSEFGYSKAVDMLKEHELCDISCVVYFADLECYQYYELSNAQQNYTSAAYFSHLFNVSSSNRRLFNYDAAFANDAAFFSRFNSYADAVVLGDIINGSYLEKTKDINIELEDEKPLSMTFDEGSVAELESAETINQYITYVTEQSIDLQELQDTIVDAEQNSATTIKGAIESQTGSLLDGFTKGLSDVFVPDTTMWKEEFDKRIARVKDATAVLTLPLLVITPLFAIITDAGEIGDFILSIPELVWMDVVLYGGYDWNVTQWTAQYDFLQNILDLLRLLGNVYITCCLANYGAKKFTTIVEGGR